jgi:hypothetical protein
MFDIIVNLFLCKFVNVVGMSCIVPRPTTVYVGPMSSVRSRPNGCLYRLGSELRGDKED